jgi:hypothetical protein
MDKFPDVFPSVHSVEPPTGDSPFWLMSMELAEGRSLSSFLQEDRADATHRWQVALRIVDTVRMLHDGDISHGDLWPDNIFVAEDCRITLIDPGRSGSGNEFPHAEQLRYDRQRLCEIIDSLAPIARCRELFARSGGRLSLDAIRRHVDAARAADGERPRLAMSSLLRHWIRFDETVRAIDGAERDFIRAARKRVRDCYLLTEYFDTQMSAIADVVAAIVLEASHRIDDFYDSKEKWSEYGYRSTQTVYDHALTALARCLDHYPNRAAILSSARQCIKDAEVWTQADSFMGVLSPDVAIARVELCNAASYASLFKVLALLGPAPQAMEAVFRAYGFLAWVADDWRDLELDNARNHFNIFRYYFFKLDEQLAFRQEVVKNRLDLLGTGATWLRDAFLAELGLDYLTIALEGQSAQTRRAGISRV